MRNMNRSVRHPALPFLLLTIILVQFLSYSCSPERATTVSSIEQLENAIVFRSTKKAFSGIARSTYRNGQHRLECTIRNGRITEWKRWYPNGVLEYHAIARDARLKDTALSYQSLLERNPPIVSGDFAAYHPNNQIAVKIRFQNGFPEGIARLWDPNGNLRSEIDFSRLPRPVIQLFDNQSTRFAEIAMRNTLAVDLFASPIAVPGTPTALRMIESRFFHPNGYVHIHVRHSRDGRSLDFVETWDNRGNRIRRPQEEDHQIKFRLGDHNLAMNWVSPGELTRSVISRYASGLPLKIEHGFWLGIHEVTQEQWNAVMDKNPSFFDTNDRKPVENVTWHEANEFCRRLTRMQSELGKLPIGYQFDLPTHDQWEYAFRAGDTGLIPLDFRLMIPAMEDTNGRTHPVASARPNAWGFHDMLSNVAEWGYEGNSLRWTKDPPMAKPVLLDSYRTAVVMGGSTAYKPRRCNYLRKYSEDSNARYRTIGFRVALVPTYLSLLSRNASEK